MDLDLKGKNALVCGSSKGIGKAAALEIAALGANVTLVSRSVDLMTDIIHEMDSDKDQHHDFLVADFTNSGDLNKKVKGLVALKPIHILVNNTGGPPGGMIMDSDEADFLQAYHNHLICNHLLVRLVVKGMKRDEYGRIINVISTSVKEPIMGLGVSNTTRGAVANWAKTLSQELGPFGITVNNVLPGYTNTDRLKEIIVTRSQKTGISEEKVTDQMRSNVPLRRIASPAEVGAAIAFLASPAASYINGINLPVDGGRTKSL